MSFSSLLFLLIFLPVFLLLYITCPAQFKTVLLLVASLCFYAFGEPGYILFLLISLGINYWFSYLVSPTRSLSTKARKYWLFLAVFFNIFMLILFKTVANKASLPLGVSFFTFQIISYLVDVYRFTIYREESFVKYSTYVCMFPQLVAGPIVTYGEVCRELYEPKLSLEGFDDGLKKFVHGLVLKVLVADRLGIIWNEIGNVGYESISAEVAWFGAIAFSLQIYFDFYGYSLMAIGLGEMLGFHLPKNFDTPYAAKSISDFFRRWHITLSRWFKNYVYIPLGGNQVSAFRLFFNLFVVWFLTAAWHGIGANYFMWGYSIYFFIVLEKTIAMGKKRHATKRASKEQNQKKIPLLGVFQKTPFLSYLGSFSKHLYVLLVLPVTWVMFAITDVTKLITYLHAMFGFSRSQYFMKDFFFELCKQFGVTLLIGIILATPIAEKLIEKCNKKWIGSVLWAILFWVCIWYLVVMGENPFMYFRF